MKRTARAAGLVAALLLAACASGQPPAEEASIVASSAIVEAVDPASRGLRLRDEANGEVFSVTAGPEVSNFAQIEPGDRVEIEFLHSTVLEMADPADPGDAVTMVGGGRAPEGARPGGAAVISSSVVVEVLGYDADSGFATVRLPDGTIRRTAVAPGLRAFAERRRPGDRVLVTITDAVAVEVTET